MRRAFAGVMTVAGVALVPTLLIGPVGARSSGLSTPTITVSVGGTTITSGQTIPQPTTDTQVLVSGTGCVFPSGGMTQGESASSGRSSLPGLVTANLIGPAGLIATQTLLANTDGTWSLAFVLAALSPAGVYSITATCSPQANGVSTSSAFRGAVRAQGPQPFSYTTQLFSIVTAPTPVQAQPTLTG